MTSIKNRTLYLRVKTLYSNLTDIATAVFILPLLTFLSLNTFTNIIYWWLIYLITSLFFLFKSWRFRKTLNVDMPREGLKYGIAHWTNQTCFFALMWALLPWIIPNPTPNTTLMTAFVAAGVTAGTTISCATFPKVSFVYSLTVLASLITNLIYLGENENFILATEVFLYLILLMKMQRTLFSFFMKTFSTMVELDSANEKIKQSQIAAMNTSRLAAQAEMTANLAHEINNPLAVIHLKTEHMLRCLEKGELSTDTIKKTCNKNLLMVNRMQEIISSTKKYFYHNQLEPENETTVLKDVLNEISGVFSEKCRNRGIQFNFKNDLNCTVLGSRTALIQVITNLLNNSFDAIKDQTNGTVSLSTHQIQNDITIQIIDSGKGIPIELKDKIFEPFYTTKGKGAGLGMGLSVCVGLVKQMGGELWLENTAPTTFKIKLKKFQTAPQ